MIKYSTCKLELSKVEIQVKGIFEDNTDDELYFQHPTTGLWYEDVNKVLQGWEEQNSDEQAEWEVLVSAIRQDDNLAQKIYDDIEVIEY